MGIFLIFFCISALGTAIILFIDDVFQYLKRNKTSIVIYDLKIGDLVEKYTGDYQLQGEVRAVFFNKKGNTRYVVEHEPGFLHIYSRQNLRKINKVSVK